ncbi:phage N-6-adenine-methyltransferase [Shewanella avicenniae]|uniref:Phage N-6-adenine-methyltransferase n=1 Tax=Shewanella avicenniae TaxID=2814294 RepID=A0ABX7QM15_9GAMM|nr:phage N-6-adenine-methyltransferase [Shewanella avicenniae]QSX32493.1 phage N-6-adenine-methyltransferase [Shewanella avicenniae]
MPVGFANSSTPVEIRNLWRTPDFAFVPLNNEFRFALDVAADAMNAKVPDNFITAEENALTVSWADRIPAGKPLTAWCNPPYDNIQPWLDKAHFEASTRGLTTVCFVPLTPDAGWWPTNASEIRQITGVRRKGDARNISGRVKFIRADTGKPVNGQNKGSCYIIFAPFTLGNMTTKYVPITQLIDDFETFQDMTDCGVYDA